MKLSHHQVASWPKSAFNSLRMSFSRSGLSLIGMFTAIVVLNVRCCFAVVAQPLGGLIENPNPPVVPTESACSDSSAKPQIRQALQIVCLNDWKHGEGPGPQRTIVIGFLGGFVKSDDKNHPEVWFTRYLREHYASAVYARVFANGSGKAALRQVLRLLDTNCDGNLSASEKENARIIVFGHSWGASETTMFARALKRQKIPVLLTIQIDPVSKPLQKPYLIPPNVKEAVNFFQSRGLFHGRPGIVAADPAQTSILGDFPMTYTRQSVDCGNFPWLGRTFNKPHHEIENDPRVWDRIGALIDAQIRSRGGTDQAALVATEQQSRGTD